MIFRVYIQTPTGEGVTDRRAPEATSQLHPRSPPVPPAAGTDGEFGPCPASSLQRGGPGPADHAREEAAQTGMSQ